MIRPALHAMAANADIAGIVLAGGRGQRLGRGEKGLCRLGGHSLLERALARAAPQTASLLLSFNGDSRSLPACVVPVIPDTVPGFAGPLAGVLAGLEYLRAHQPGTRWLASFASMRRAKSPSRVRPDACTRCSRCGPAISPRRCAMRSCAATCAVQANSCVRDATSQSTGRQRHSIRFST